MCGRLFNLFLSTNANGLDNIPEERARIFPFDRCYGNQVRNREGTTVSPGEFDRLIEKIIRHLSIIG